MIDFNTEPYNDDYDETKKFYRILFRPSFAVQARELTQLQTILQNQITRHGDNIFKQGAMVVPGQVSVETASTNTKGADYVKLQSMYNGVAVATFIDSLNGIIITGSSGLKAQVIVAQRAEETDPSTLYVRYLNSSTDGTQKVFANNEVIHTDTGLYFQAQATAATGKGSLATVERGVYYVNGHFVLCDTQSIVLDKYTATPSYRVGLDVTESIITPEDDETLLDNAQNSYNFAAPGAHRYYMELTLNKRSLSDTDDQNFVELIRVTDGVTDTIVKDTQYNVIYTQIESELQRRTFDTNGDYTVNGWSIDVRENRNNNRGTWTQNTAYLIGDIVSYGGNTYVAKNSASSVTTAPTHTSGTAYDGTGNSGVNWQYDANPVYNRGINLAGDEGSLSIGIEPGKAYVQGAEIEKIATTYITVPKARDYDQAVNSVISPVVGNYVIVTNLNYLPPVDTGALVNIYDGVTGSSYRGNASAVPSANLIGTARARFIEWHNILPYGSTSQYKLGLFDIQMKSGYDFNRSAKSFYTVGASSATSFSADVQPILYNLSGNVTASASTTLTGAGTSFQTDLKVGDYILINDTTYRRVTAIASQTSLTVDSAVTVSSVKYQLVTTVIQEATANSLIFPLAYSSIRSMRTAGNSGVNNVNYTAYVKFNSVNTSTTTLALTTSGTFASAADNDNYTVVKDSDGSVVNITSSNVSVSGSNVSITVPSSGTYTVVAAVIRTGSGFEKSKTLTQATETFTTATSAQQAAIILDKADVFRIVSIKMAPTIAFGGSPTSVQYTQDISERYQFDNGQRLTHYDYGRLNLLPSYTQPSNPIQIVYEYFEHGAGDYFDVNSYSGIDYKQIPANLRDSIDFRPRVANKTTGSGVKNFTSTGSSMTSLPKRGEYIKSDYSYYLARRDKIILDPTGKLVDIQGVPSIVPGEPAGTAVGMVLYNITLEPYTFGTSNNNVYVSKVENKRYTMRDIGKLESRINNLEYYTSLSLLEAETSSLKIPDSTGLDRMKNGFVVDNFGSSALANSKSGDFKCSIDMAANVLRPAHTMHNVDLVEQAATTSARTSANYQLTGDIITLPYTTKELIKQQYASRLENVNPFAIYTFLGNVQISPPSDDWFDTVRAPDFVQQVEGNYNALKNMVDLNNGWPVYGAWTTEWTGTPEHKISYSTFGVTGAATNQFGAGGGGGARRDIVVQQTTDTWSQTGVKSRTGTKTAVVAKTDYEKVGDRVVSTAIVPYVRSRYVLVQSKGLKPSTRFYAYFNEIDINAYCTPTTKLIYTPTGATESLKAASHKLWDISTNVGGSSTDAKRRIGTDVQVCLTRGDVITKSDNSASAVIVGKYTVDNGDGTTSYVLDLVNVIGTFSSGNTFNGSISGQAGTVISISTNTTLTTNQAGEVNFLFNIPNTEALRFRTGKSQLKLVDSSTSSGNYTSRGLGQYEATGTLQTVQSVVNAVRNADFVKEQINPSPNDPNTYETVSRGGTSTANRIISDTGWYDPLAQSFLIQQRGGAFLTSIDLFFATKDASIPVSVHIREMVNGSPGKYILPFSTVTLKPDSVNAPVAGTTPEASGYVSVALPDGNSYADYNTATKFTFESPVYVQDGAEYAFVIQSDSNNYKVWISNMGDVIPGTSRTISEQPYAGVMFKSQNASTWTPDQNQDIKFTLHRAVFATDTVGAIVMVNNVNTYDQLYSDPIQTVSGSTTVRIWHPNHGMSSGSSVQLTGLTSAVNGIPAAEINTTKVISNVDAHCYTITTTTAATSTGYAGGNLLKASKNIAYDLINPTLQMQTFSETKGNYYIKTTSGISPDGGQTPYVLDSSYSPVLIGEDNIWDQPRIVASEVNENTYMSGAKSLMLLAQISTTNDSVSPVIDTARSSAILVSNKLNYATESNTNVAALDTKLMFAGSAGTITGVPNTGVSVSVAGGTYNYAITGTALSLSGSQSLSVGTQYYYGNRLYVCTVAGTASTSAPTHTYGIATNGTASLQYVGSASSITSTNSTVRGLMAGLGIGRYIITGGSANSVNNGTWLVTGYGDDGTTGTVYVDSTAGNVFTAETVTSSSIYVAVKELFYDEIAPVGGSSLSKYVTTPIKFANSSTYTRIKIGANCPNEADIKVYYKTCLGDSSQLDTIKYNLAQADGNGLIKVDNGNYSFSDVDYTLTSMTPFDTIAVKIVMQSTNTAATPIVKDFRVIACA